MDRERVLKRKRNKSVSFDERGADSPVTTSSSCSPEYLTENVQGNLTKETAKISAGNAGSAAHKQEFVPDDGETTRRVRKRTFKKAPAILTSSDGTSTRSTPSPAASHSFREAKDFRSWEVGERYTMVRLLGHGSYGEVAEAVDKESSKRVAIKRIENVFDQAVDAKRIYREMYILQRLRHEDVIALIDIIKPKDLETFKHLYLVFEFVDTDLYKLILSPQYLTVPHIQTFLYQMLCGLKYIHSANVIHRDMKPANILLNEDCSLKICDFGLARVIDGPSKMVNPMSTDGGLAVAEAPDSPHPPLRRQLTKHVVTRWYRAPELILLQEYGPAVDMWSVGCILAELLSMQTESLPNYHDRSPLFPGKTCFPLSADMPNSYSDKLDQLNVIFDVLGTPAEDDIESLGEVRQYLRKLPKKGGKSFAKMYPGAPPEAIDLLCKMLQFNPDKRITVDEALSHKFLQQIRKPEREKVCEQRIVMDFEDKDLSKEELKALVYQEVQRCNEKSPSKA